MSTMPTIVSSPSRRLMPTYVSESEEYEEESTCQDDLPDDVEVSFPFILMLLNPYTVLWPIHGPLLQLLYGPL